MCTLEKAIGFDELRWLQELSAKTPKMAVPERIGELLLKRRLIERNASGFTLTARGRIALAKLG